MEKQDSWKKTEDIPVNLADLLRRLCMQWKRIAFCALAGALLAGGFGLLRAKSSPQEPQAESLEDFELTEEEWQGVIQTAGQKRALADLENYMQQSAAMQTNPYHRNRTFLLYSITHASRKELAEITESYLSFAANGGAADALKKRNSRRWDMDKSCLAELISAYQKTYSFPYQIAAGSAEDAALQAESLFYVEVTAENQEMTARLAEDMQEVIKAHAETVRKEAGNHRLSLLSRQENVVYDRNLQSYQNEQKNQLQASRSSLKAAEEALTSVQAAAYEELLAMEEKDREKDAGTAAGKESEKDGEKDTDTDTDTDIDKESEKDGIKYLDKYGEKNAQTGSSGQEEDGSGAAGIPLRRIFKFVFLGLFGGAFAYCGIFACVYLFRDTVKSAEEMKERYAFPVYGEIPAAVRRNASGIRRSTTPDGASGQEHSPRPKRSPKQEAVFRQQKERVLSRVRLACEKRGITKICFAAGSALDAGENTCLLELAQKLNGFGIHADVVENASTDTAVWDSLAQTGNIILVCRMGITTHRMIDEEMEFYTENHVTVAGAVIFA